jgi:hypothetical protein
MKPSRGYYSLIQYCPDLGRFEAANVGVLLFCPERGFLKARTASTNARISRFFGSHGHDWKRINVFKKGIEDRLQREGGRIRSLDDLEQFIARRANRLQITPPRATKVIDPEKDLNELFRQIIGDSVPRPSAKSLQAWIRDAIRTAGIEKKIRPNVKVEVPVLQKEIEVPFAFQNGRFNLLYPVGFPSADPERSVTKACKFAVEGRSLHEHEDPRFGDLQLFVIGKFRPGDLDSPVRVRRVLEENQVRLYRADELAMLIDEIRRTGKDLAPVESTAAQPRSKRSDGP